MDSNIEEEVVLIAKARRVRDLSPTLKALLAAAFLIFEQEISIG